MSVLIKHATCAEVIKHRYAVCAEVITHRQALCAEAMAFSGTMWNLTMINSPGLPGYGN